MHYDSDSKAQYWNRIAFISFVLAVMIIIRHNSSFAQYSSMGGVENLFSELYNAFKYSFTEIAVPAFFVVAGFNFYNGFSIQSYGNKLRRRIKSLLVPYITWNTIYCAFVLITSNTFISQYFVGREEYAFSIWNVIKGCIYHWSCNSHFWFVFNLILFAVISPFAYKLLKNKRLGAFVLLGCILVIIGFNFSLPEKLIYRTDSIVYYFIGAYLAIHYKNAIVKDEHYIIAFNYRNNRFLSVVCGISCMLSTLLLLIPELQSPLRFVIICIGIIGFWMTSVVVKDGIPSWIPSGGTVFLMYAIHGIIQPIIVKLLFLALPKQSWVSLVNFFLSVVLTILLCFSIRHFTKKYMTRLDKILVGWRV